MKYIIIYNIYIYIFFTAKIKFPSGTQSKKSLEEQSDRILAASPTPDDSKLIIFTKKLLTVATGGFHWFVRWLLNKKYRFTNFFFSENKSSSSNIPNFGRESRKIDDRFISSTTSNVIAIVR
jgi:hypothetical protein